jgi:hypothetical protein
VTEAQRESTAEALPSLRNARPELLKVSKYDRVASMLISLLMLIGTTVTIMLLMWLSSQFHAGQAAVPVTMEQIGEGDDVMGGGSELEPPPVEEVTQEFYEPELKDTVSTIATAVIDKSPLLDELIAEQTPRGGKGKGKGTGVGDGVGPGKGRGRRWEVQFPKDNTLEDYARQLDFFGIELGVLVPGNKVEYAFNMSKAKPDRRVGSSDQEKRYYLSWRRGELEEADRELLGRAGINCQGRVILKFLPPAIEATLAQLEKTRAGDDYQKIRTTRFAIRLDSDAYAFYVIEQTYK